MKDLKDKLPMGGGVVRGGQMKTGKRTAVFSSHRPLVDSVLRLMWKERRISRAEIAHRMELSRSTASEIVESLLKTGFVKEVGTGHSIGGRRPIVLEFQDDAKGILGIDIGATHVAVALTDLRGQVHEWKEKEHPVRSDPEGTRSLIMELCDECLASAGYNARRLLGIGVAVPSPVDPLHPEWLSETVIPAWHGRSELERLNYRYGVPVFVDNDANLGALAEHWWGAARGLDDMMYIKLAYGIGAGYILAGEVYRGAGGVAGEIGHLPIDPNGPQCVCGLKGCLVKFVGAEALTERVQSLLPNNPQSALSNVDLTIEAIEEAALAGDGLALQVARETADYLGIAITGWINLMNPSMIVLGGSLSRLGELLLEPIREKVRRGTLVSAAAAAKIRTSELGARAVAIGAATLAFETVFANPDLLRRRPRPKIV
jgi:glucokinase-like ROK family protein